MKKRRINFYFPGDIKETISRVVLVETMLAINGIKAVGYVEETRLNPPYDWEMQQKAADENSSIVNACDMVVFDDDDLNENERRVLCEAKEKHVPVFVFQGTATSEVGDFRSCILECNRLLGRTMSGEPVLIQ